MSKLIVKAFNHTLCSCGTPTCQKTGHSLIRVFLHQENHRVGEAMM
ncbi:MAG: hypothetical protein IKH43_03435 [Bacteroidaceae bacterium]|nr:hypothetical protein [Bacteroidaceae bacterium]